MAVATGAVIANMYYAQPLLHEIAQTFHAGVTATSLIVTCTQGGFALAVVLVLPLGDLHPRRRLIAAMYGLAAIGLVVCALAPTLWLFEVASAATGLASIGGQIMVPFAADLATPARRGRIVARLMTGVLLGILLARTLSGLTAQFAGWRAIYWISAALMLVFAVVLHTVLPSEPARRQVPYRRLVASTFALFLREPVLRRRGWYGGLAFGEFTLLWTSLAFVLSGAPYHYSSLVIGLFGLAGVGGVAAANLAGKLADARRVPLTTALAALCIAGSFALLAAGRSSLALLLLGIVILDVGVEGLHITNQAVIYEIAPDARSRVNSAYLTCFFIGGTLGSVAAGTVFAAVGWSGVCGVGAGLAALALATTALDRWRPVGRPVVVSRPSGVSTPPARTPPPLGGAARSAEPG
jgi:predicted MFS family arabinose efflux permease